MVSFKRQPCERVAFCAVFTIESVASAYFTGLSTPLGKAGSEGTASSAGSSPSQGAPGLPLSPPLSPLSSSPPSGGLDVDSLSKA